MRTITNQEANRLKAAFRASLDKAGGGEFSHSTRVNAASLSKYVQPEDWDSDPKDRIGNFPGLDVVVECDRLAGHPHALEAALKILGYGIHPLEPENGKGRGVTFEDALTLTEENHDVVRLAHQIAAKGGRADARDRMDLIREIGEARQVQDEILRKAVA